MTSGRRQDDSNNDVEDIENHQGIFRTLEAEHVHAEFRGGANFLTQLVSLSTNMGYTNFWCWWLV